MEIYPPRNRCVYVYYRHRHTTEGSVVYPYYVGKGTIRRAYDWVRHTAVPCPKDAADIHILAKDMTDIDAQQAEILLIYLFGRKLDKRVRETIRPEWSSSSYRADITGTLDNRTIGGDGPASRVPEAILIAELKDQEFKDNNPCFWLTRHADGYWYSPQYPKIKSTRGGWIRKKSTGCGRVREKLKRKRRPRYKYDLASRIDEKWPNSLLHYAEQVHYQRFGNIDCGYRYDNDCRCSG